MIELESIVGKELDEAERRIHERTNDVIVRELREARMQIRKRLIDFMISLQEVLRKSMEKEALKQTATNIPVDKGDKKTRHELISELQDLEESEKS